MKHTLLPTHAFINKAKLLKYFLLPVILAVMISCTTSLKAQDINFNVKSFRGGYNISCNGSADGSIDALVIGGTKPFTYLWNTGATTQGIANIPAGHYSLTVTDAAGQVVSKSVTLIEPDLLDVFLYPSKFEGGYNVSKTGSSDGSIKIDIKGGTPPYKILWSTGSKKEFLDNLMVGTYSVTITDQNNCTITKSVTLIEPTPLQIISITATNHNGYGVSCADSKSGDPILSMDGSITLVVSGAMPPYKFYWSNGSFNQNPNHLYAGEYKVRVFDANGATVEGLINITQPPKIQLALTLSSYPNGYNISCNGCSNGTITSVASGGASPYSYLWNAKGSVNGQTTANLNNLSPGEYTLFLTDANGCKIDNRTTLNEPSRDDWSLNGNNVNSNQFIGTTGYQPLVFKTANSTRMVIDANGALQVNNLAGANNRLLQTNANGILSPLTMGTTNQVVLGDGTLGAMPAPGLWSATGTDAFFNAGKVGIGTSTPQYPLDVVGNAVVNGSLIASNLMLGTPSNNFQINTLALPSGGSVAAFGIGPQLTPSCVPEYTDGNAQFNRLSVFSTSNNNVVDIRNDGNNGYIDFGHDAVTSVNPTIALKINSRCSSNITLNENGGNVYMCNPAIGNVGIGTSTPNAKLDVNGNSILHGKVVIGTQQLTASSLHYADALLTVSGKVVMQSAFATVSNWADYVFNENYRLPKLNEVENYYKTNKHLSGIPSEKEVIENGVDLAEMNKLLLKKIEELTLYVVEQNKRIEKLEQTQNK